MSVFREYNEIKKYILYLIGKPVKILEIGIHKGENIQKLTEIFFEKNKKCEYYGIDEWKYESKAKSKDIENIANYIRDLNTYKKNIFYIKNDPIEELNKLIKKNEEFDIIIINTYDEPKKVLYHSILAFELLEKNGIIIFNDYIKLQTHTTKDSIDEILASYKDEIDILYIGNQIIIKKKNVKYDKKMISNLEIINEVNIKLYNYWEWLSPLKLILVLEQLKELPKIEPVYNDSSSENKINNKFNLNMDIFKKLNIENVIYKYHSMENIKRYFKKNLKSLNFIDYKYENLNKLLKNQLNENNIFNLVTIVNRYGISHTEFNLEVNYNNIQIINSLDPYTDTIYLNNEMLINDVIERAILYSEKKYKIFRGSRELNSNNFTKLYNNILLQTLLIKYILKINENNMFTITLSVDDNFINDYLILLNYIFKKVYINTFSNKIGFISLRINCIEFLGINNILYDKIYNILIKSEKKNSEIISLFEVKNNNPYLVYNNTRNHINNRINSIISFFEENQDIIINNINIIKNYQKQNTINDLIFYLKKIAVFYPNNLNNIKMY
jgi:hypothetical protein